MGEQQAVADVIRDLVIANRILAREDVIDDFGHVSVRHPHRDDRFFLSRSRSPEIVTRDDIMEFELDGTPIEANGRRPYLERFIHAAIYSQRPEFNAVTHHHARSVIPFTVTPVPLKPVFHMGSVIGQQVPLWDSQDAFGDTNMLVDSLEMGQSLTQAMAGGRTVLLRGHGAVCAAESLRAVCMISVYLKENADLILKSRPLGEPLWLTSGEIDKAAAMLLSDIPLERAWSYWCARAGFGGV